MVQGQGHVGFLPFYNEKNCKVFQVIFSRFLAFQTNV